MTRHAWRRSTLRRLLRQLGAWWAVALGIASIGALAGLFLGVLP